MNRLLIICGPTATGKTVLAAKLAKRFNGVIISADSRQVYKYMDIGTGKDRLKDLPILGYDLVRPDEEFSVANYANFAFKAIKEVYAQKKLPILVGGTGLYIKAIVDDLSNIYIPRNQELRKRLKDKTVTKLFAMIMQKNPFEAMRLNQSDRSNPHRLIRILEIASSNKIKPEIGEDKIKFDDILWLGLKVNKESLDARIDERVEQRVKAGMEKEVGFLEGEGYLSAVPQKTLGYQQWSEYLAGKTTKQDAIQRWKNEEKKYAKRQMTWFKKENRIKWFDISERSYAKNIENMVQRWYDR